jgi:hypothetical protein
MGLLTPVGVGKPGCPVTVSPLALNQVNMRLPHDADGGRDTEKLRYRGMGRCDRNQRVLIERRWV